jgi:transcription-repair coupling factor (superfamily II helicase)
MKLCEIHKNLKNLSQYKMLLNDLQREEYSKIFLKELEGASDALLASAFCTEFKGEHIFILNNKEEAAYFYNDLIQLLPDQTVLFFPSSYKKAYQIEETENANVLLRAEVLNTLQHKENVLIVTYPKALSEKVVTRKTIQNNTLKLTIKEKISISFIVEILNEYSFERTDFVFEPGQFSVRGGIVDIFSFSNNEPFRIEFLGDEVDSIRTFNPSDQLSISKLNEAYILPNIQQKFSEEKRQLLLEFVSQGTIWIKDVEIAAENLNQEFEKANSLYNEVKSNAIRHLPPNELLANEKEFLKQLLFKNVIEFGYRSFFENAIQISFHTSPQPIFNKNFDLLAENLQKNSREQLYNVLLSSNIKQYERLTTIFESTDKEIQLSFLKLNLRAGFIFHDINIAAYTDHQIFNRFHKFNLKSSNDASKIITLKELNNLSPGDYVTHIDHGVGKFSGLEKIDFNGKMQESIRIIYKNGDILYVSIHSLHKISKYVGKDGTEPSLDKLGSGSWEKVKQKTKKRVKEIAFDLISLYAKRKASKGFAFSPDNYLMKELAASFIYEDTPDQHKATIDVKKDMEADYPMDRLICGDVGFGKTEIAVRAAFKAVCDSKQVAILVPTTILALQHFKTFSDRLAEFPCNIDYLNRFKSAKQQKETLKKVAEGKIDILIGTHRLLGNDVKYKDIGLLIIDEEQKFGVSAKDKLKTIKVNIDTLTLTATPIPRTLQFSLMNARDLSVINTPPPNRQPILTELHGFNEEIIRDAVFYEISRGGQVFFINNRIQNIVEVTGMLQRLCPDARILYAHGQMKGDELEEKMLAFVNEEYDVLVSTTIIESGLDIPNANTIIINDAHLFGLSDLHQMRGRVGRSNQKAFCYLIAPPISVLTDEARKRLRAIEQFSDLGSGFQISMRDLDIRGAGNILGAEQSGFISEMGFDMYQKIIQEAIQELKENEFKELYAEELKQNNFLKECTIETDLEILIPDNYVSNITERLNLYTELDLLKTEEELQIFKNKLNDRFGYLPNSTCELLDTIRLRWIAEQIGFEKIVLKQNKLISYFISDANSGYYQSEKFGRVLQIIKLNNDFQMKEKGNKLYLLFNEVKSIKEALSKISKINEQITLIPTN